jgi:DNA-binding NtrC family response regulator
VTASRKCRILLVDDEPSLLLTYRLLLEREGYEVVACGTFREAIAAIKKYKFDVVLCDYFLEEQHTGLEVVSAARQLDPGIPAAVLTGYVTGETSEQAASERVVVMLKPVAIPEFLATTSNLLRKSNGPSEPGSG